MYCLEIILCTGVCYNVYTYCFTDFGNGDFKAHLKITRVAILLSTKIFDYKMYKGIKTKQYQL